MRALTARPNHAGSLEVAEVAEPEPARGELLVDGIAIGVCGTDKEIASGNYGWAPPGSPNLILGHESLGRVREAPANSEFSTGDLVVGVVRRPDPEPCGACAHGQFDMCRNGLYRERGIKQLHGYGSQTWTVETDYAVKLASSLHRVGVLMEPTTVVAKAWEQVELTGARSWFEPRTALITGAGPIGLLAALIAIQKGLDTHVLDVVTKGNKPQLVHALGATYHYSDVDSVAARLRPDVVIEATGVAEVVFGAMQHTSAYGITCLTGVSPIGRKLRIDAGSVNRDIVLENDVVLGSVNANLSHYHQASEVLAKADVDWLERLITRRVSLEKAQDAFAPQPDDVKVIIELGPAEKTR